MRYLLVALPAPLQERKGRRRLKLSPHQIALYCLLINREKDGKAELSTASMAGLLGVDVRTVRSALTYPRRVRAGGTLPREDGPLGLPPLRRSNWNGFRPGRSGQEGAAVRRRRRQAVGGMTDQEIHEWVVRPDRE